MPICLLCKEGEADQRNSHILPLFLIKTAISEEGRTERDCELTFGIGSNHFVETYFGRNISPETIERIRGRELTDNEIGQNINPSSRDNIICTYCERRFSVIESYIADRLYNRMIDGNLPYAANDKKGNPVIEPTDINALSFLLFVYSLFWRCATFNYQGFILNDRVKENIRFVLDSFLDLDYSLIERNLVEHRDRLILYPIIATYNESREGDDPTVNFISTGNSKRPYLIMANQMSFQLFEKEVHLRSTVEYLYGISQIIDNQEAAFYGGTRLRIVVLNPEKSRVIQARVYELLVEQERRQYRKLFKVLHYRALQFNCPPLLLEFFSRNFFTADRPIGDKFTMQRFVDSAFDAIDEYRNM